MSARITLMTLLTVLLTAAPLAAEVLFPVPLHLTREVEDPLSGGSARIEEYCVGNRVVSVRGSRTSIADYEEGTLTEIDRASGTFSVTRFEQIARVQGEDRSSRSKAQTEIPRIEARGVRGVGSRTGDVSEAIIESEGRSRQTIEVVVDRSLSLSKDAIEVLTGAAWPSRRGPESDVVLRAAAKDSAAGRSQRASYGLPLEQVVTFEIEGETLRTVNRVVRVGNEVPPPDLTAIPPGAREVPSPIVERERLLEELDQLPTQARP